MTLDEAKLVAACLDDTSEEYAVMQREISRLTRRRSTKFYVIDRLVTFLRRHRDELDLDRTYPRETVENLLLILEEEGWL